MMRLIYVLPLLFLLTACETLFDGILGNFTSYDPNEYNITVELVHESRKLEKLCDSPDSYKEQIVKLEDRAEYFVVYSEGRDSNKRVLKNATYLSNLVASTASRVSMSKPFCVERSRNIVKATEILRSSSGGKTE